MTETPNSGSEPYKLIDQLAEEFAARYRGGERPSLKEYLDRYPELADEIRELFPALARLEQAEEVLHRDAPEDGPQPGLRRLGDFQIVRELGRGGMGIVYEAEQLSLGRRVAVKVLPHHAAHDRRATERFRREARAAARLHHTNIVPVFEVGQEGDVSFYAMQFIRGQGLDAVIDELRRLRGRPGPGGPASPPPAPASPVAGPLAEDPGMVSPRAAAVSQAARSLLTGRFAPGGPGATATGPEPSRESVPVATHAMPAGGGRDGRGPSAATAGHTRSVSPRPAPARVPAATESSAVLPGGSQLSAVEAGDRGYFRSVAHIGRQAAQALAYAHARGIVHRDIKPSNLLLDTEGVVWVTDFGLAKADDDGLTRTGDLIGTLRYMAPERFHGGGDARADIYALGLTLYELLTLRPAFDSPDRLRLVERIQAEEPPRPRALDPRIPRDLETIVAKASDKDPRRRYATADELAEDLRRFLDGEPIRARRVSETERAWKWVRRRPALSAALALLAVSMVVGTAASVTFAIRATVNAERASERTTVALRAQAQAQAARVSAERARRDSSLQSAGLLFDRGQALASGGEVGPGMLWMLEALRSAPEDAEDLRRVIRMSLAAWGRRLARVRWMIPADSGLGTLALSPDGTQVAVSEGQGTVRVYDAGTGRPICRALPRPHPPGPPHPWMSYTAGGKALVVPGEGVLRRYDAVSYEPAGEPLRWPTQPPGATYLGVVPSPNGRVLLAITTAPERFHLFDADSGAPLGENGWGAGAQAASFLADGRIFLFRQVDREVSEVELRDDEGRRRVAGPWAHRYPGVRDRWSRAYWPNLDGRSYWCRSRPGWVQQYGMADGRPIGPPVQQAELRVFAFQTGCPVLNLPGARGFLFLDDRGPLAFFPSEPSCVGTGFLSQTTGQGALGPDGRWLVSVGSLFAIRRDFGDDWTKVVKQGRPEASPRSGFEDARYSPEAGAVILRAINVSDDEALLVIRETSTGRPRGPGIRFRLDAYSGRFPIAVSPDGGLAAAATGRTIRVFETRTGRAVGRPLHHLNTVSALAFGPDGKTLVAGDYSHAVQFWDVASGRPTRPPLIQPDIVLSLDVRPDGRAIAVGTANDRSGRAVLKLWDLTTGAPIGREVLHPSWVGHARFSPDGRTVVSVGGPSVRFTDARTAEPIGEPIGFPGEVPSPHPMAFSPDGRVVLIGTSRGRARLFDVATARAIPGKVFSHPDEVEMAPLAISPDGRLVLIGYADGTARLWDAASAQAIGPAIRIGERVLGVAFTPDGLTAMATSTRGATHRWPVPRPVDDDLESLALRLELETGMQLEPGPAVATLNAAEWAQRRERLIASGKDPDVPLAPRADDAEWHAFRAFEAEEAGGTETPLWHLERLSALRPDDGTIAARIGACHAEAGRFDRAAAAYDRAEGMREAGGLPDWYRLRAAECLAARRYEVARWYLDRILAREPDDARALADRAAVRSAHGDATGAEADLARAATLADDSELLVALGSKLARAGRWPESGAAFARASAVGPFMYVDRSRAALALLRAGDLAGFRTFVDRLLDELDPPPASAVSILRNNQAGVLGPTTPVQASRLAALFDQAVERLKRWPDAPADLRHGLHWASGAALVRAGRHSEAIARLEQGIAAGGGRRSPQDDAFLALARQALGQGDEALRCLERLARAGPSGDFWKDLEVQQLRREAEAAIKSDAAFPRDPFDRD